MAVRNAKARENGGNYSLSDGDGLMLLVKKSGAKSWVLNEEIGRASCRERV